MRASTAGIRADPPRLELARLTYRIGDRRLVDEIDLVLDSPGCTVVMGPNGAGKSILLRLLHGLLRPSAGTVRWDGRPLSPALTAQQALVFQTPVLLRRTALQNLDFVLRVRGRDRRRAIDLLARVGLAERADAPARRLSGGEQQRLALARALAIEPRTLFLDEPTASLDPASVQLIEQLTGELTAAGTKTFFVTHDTAQARRLADDVLFLHRGRLVEQASAGRFFTTPGSTPARDYLAGRLVL